VSPALRSSLPPAVRWEHERGGEELGGSSETTRLAMLAEPRGDTMPSASPTDHDGVCAEAREMRTGSGDVVGHMERGELGDSGRGGRAHERPGGPGTPRQLPRRIDRLLAHDMKGAGRVRRTTDQHGRPCSTWWKIPAPPRSIGLGGGNAEDREQ